MNLSKRLCFLILFVNSFSYGQVDDQIFSRLQGISNRDIDFYNIDGIEITSQKIHTSCTAKSISKNFKQFKIKRKELIEGDSLLEFNNYYVFKSQEEPIGFHNNISYYFIEAPDSSTIGFTFASINKTDKEFERKFIKLVAENQIPESIFHNAQIDSLDFAGRKILLGSSCHWMGINNVQCPYYGQMNWSIHKDFNDAKKTVDTQFESLLARKNGKIIADTTVNVVFEGIETTAKRVIYDFTGMSSALVGISGGKTLTIYYVSAPVRGNYVSCVLSFWNNDQINPSGLAPLLEKVMVLD